MTATDELHGLKDRVRRRVERIRGRLLTLSHGIHADPELAFTEHHAAHAVSSLLADEGFTVEHGVGGLGTAFIARYGDGDVTIGLCAEYDALPELGHACGHNIIAAASAGAGVGLAEVADELGIRVAVVGTPAEEHGGGKVLLLERGVFDDVTVAMMVHPETEDMHPHDVATPGVARFTVTYTGRPAHAAATPHLGVNAADAAVVAQVAIGLLRQQLSGGCRIGLFVSKGGDATNIIPAETVVECEIRAFDTATMDDLHRRVVACFEAGALAAGAEVAITQTEPAYAPVRQDPVLADYYVRNLALVGRTPAPRGRRTVGSTDMGNVTQALPGLHPMIAIAGAENHPHTGGFADDARSDAADLTVLDGALALAFTGVDVGANPDARAGFRLAHRAR